MRLILSCSRLLPILLLSSLLMSCDSIKFWESDTDVGETVSTAQKEVMDVRNRATAIQSEIDRLDRRDLPPFRLGDTTLTVTLYSLGGIIRLIDERVDEERLGSARNRYYFEKESLFHFYGKSSQRLNPQESEPQFAEVSTRIYFNDAGTPFNYEHRINGLKSDMSEDELPSVMQRAEALRMLGFADVNGQIDTVAFIETLYSAKTPSASDPSKETQENVTETAATDDVAEEMAPPEEVVAEKVAPPPTQPVQKKVAPPPAQPAQKKAAPPAQPEQKKVAPPAPPAEFAKTGDADAYIEAHTHAILPGALITHRIRFQKGSTSASLSTRLKKGTNEEYVLRARRNQRMSVTVQSPNADVYFRVFLRDGDISGQRRAWSGSLPRYGDYHVVVYLRGGAVVNGDVPCTLTISIE
ncbi:MAG: hypothetical protein IH600_00715 [Bacteroidetes bacterium]|nr:hypothetical protein [Bacteroidota bacterium]